jgi:hypothetical protein
VSLPKIGTAAGVKWKSARTAEGKDFGVFVEEIAVRTCESKTCLAPVTIPEFPLKFLWLLHQ